MKKILKISFLPAVLLLIASFSLYIPARPLINWPLNLSKSLSATLGEIRGLSLHSGIDIKTNGRRGYPVVAAADGTVSRIISGKRGYGNAVFLDHGNGVESIYGHLDSFEEENHNLDTLIKTLKVLYNTEFLDFRFAEEKLQFKSGEKIAYAGESGSGLPHLHFELRKNNEFLNPLDYIPVRDTESPVIESLYVCVEKENATIYEEKISVKKNPGKYTTVIDPVQAGGDKIFFKISCYDRAGAYNHVSVYKIRLYEDEEKIFEIAFDNLTKADFGTAPFVYDISRSTIRGEISYVYFLCGKSANNFSGIKTSGKGYINFNDNNKKEIKISVSDLAGNENNLKFTIVQKNDSPVTDDYFSIESSKKSDYSCKSKNMRVIIPKGAVHENSLIKTEDVGDREIIDPLQDIYSINRTDIYGIFSIYPHDALYKKPIKINIKRPAGISKEDIEHMQIFQFFKGRKPRPLKTKYSSFKSDFEAESITNGFFALIKDKIPPKIFLPPTFEFCEDRDIYRMIRLYTSDNISKINENSIRCIIDGEIYPSDFDEDRKWIEIKLPKSELSKGLHHILIKASDEANNEAVFRGLLAF